MMAHRTVYACLIVAACLSAVCNAADRGHPHHHKPCDPTSSCPLCGGSDRAPPPGVFQYFVLQKLPSGDLHGLWPQLCNSCVEDFPYACSNKAFDVDAIPDDTLQSMKMEWRSGAGFGPNEDFWEHEWQCHGTCSGFSLPDYFTKAIEAYEQCDQQHCCFTKSLKLVDCHDECPYERSNQGAWELSISDSMLSQAMPSNATNVHYCAPKSGKCCSD